MSSTLRKRPTATVKEDTEPEVILDATEQEKVVQDLLRDAEALKAFWTPVVAVLCVVTAIVPLLLPIPPSIPTVILRLLTIPPLFASAFALVRPSSIPPELASSIPKDALLFPPIFAALLVCYTNGELFSQRTWGWTVPFAVVGLAREVESSLQGGIDSALRMRKLLYDAPTA